MKSSMTRRTFVGATAAALTSALALGTLGLAGCGTSGREPNPASDFSVEEVDGGVAITGYSGQSVEVVVPSSISGALVVAVGDGAFENKSAITYAELPDGVKRIGARAFAGCSSLAKVSLPKELASIGEKAFAGTGLTSVTVPDGVGGVQPGVFPEGCRLTRADGSAVKVSDDVTGLPVITFGTYPQSGGEPEPIEWLVLEERTDGTALLLSRRCLACRPYHGEYVDVTWEACDLRVWLNGEFLQSAFSDDERARIVVQHLENPDNPEYGTPGGAATDDSVFCLSLQEVEGVFGAKPGDTDERLIAYPTQRAIDEGAYQDDGGRCRWWLRSPGRGADSAADVYAGGCVHAFGWLVGTGGLVVRPACCVNLKS